MHEGQATAYKLALARLAQRKAAHDDIRAYSADLTENYTAYDQALQKLAKDRGERPPAEPTKAARSGLDRLSRLDGRAFDQAFLGEVRRANAGHLHEFRREASRMADPALKALIQGSLDAEARHDHAARTLESAATSAMPVIPPPTGGSGMLVMPSPPGGVFRMPVIPPPGVPEESLKSP